MKNIEKEAMVRASFLGYVLIVSGFLLCYVGHSMIWFVQY